MASYSKWRVASRFLYRFPSFERFDDWATRAYKSRPYTIGTVKYRGNGVIWFLLLDPCQHNNVSITLHRPLWCRGAIYKPARSHIDRPTMRILDDHMINPIPYGVGARFISPCVPIISCSQCCTGAIYNHGDNSHVPVSVSKQPLFEHTEM
jgi:hypothetical protein